VYNVPSLYARIRGFSFGWTQGLEALESLRSPLMRQGLLGLRRVLTIGLGLTAGLLANEAARSADLNGSSVPGVFAGVGLMAVFVVGLTLLRKRIAVTTVIYMLAVTAAAIFFMVETGMTF
jgi:hypothetical protein